MAIDKYSQNILLSSGEFEAEKDYWLNKLTGLNMSGFPIDYPRTKLTQFEAGSVEGIFPELLSRKLLYMANNSHYAVFIILLAGVNHLLHVFTGNDDLTVGIPVFQQSTESSYLNNIIALRNWIQAEMTFKELLLSIKTAVYEADKFQNFPFYKICEWLNLNPEDDLFPLFHTIVLLTNIHDKGLIEDIKADLVFSFQVQQEAIRFNLEYNRKLFKKTTVERIASYLVDLLTLVSNNTQLSLAELKLLSDEDRNLVNKYNSTESAFDNSRGLHLLFTNKARQFPRNTAIICGDQSITYQELDQRSEQIAFYLHQEGIDRGDLIGVLAYRCIESIANILGILKVGAAYVPIDPDYPEERRDYILSNSHCKRLLTPELYSRENLAQYSDCRIPDNNYPEDIAYVIYTSGSTGRPKGVVISHQAAANTIIDINQKFNVNETDRIIGLSSMCFDLSVYDIFGAFSTGAALVMVPDQRDVRNLTKVIQEQKITIWNSVPAIMDLLTSNVNDDFQNETVRLVLLSGDWIPLSLPERIRGHFKNVNIISLGGATEASIWSIYFPITEIKEEWPSIPYGMPLANQKFYVLNSKMNICPVGVQGELFIGGLGVARGYHNDAEKTKNSFIHHSELGYIYKTGDYGVLHQEGYIEFLGRKDHQVKIRGYRIELGEIENALFKYEGVKNAVVIDRMENTGKKYLCAYLVTDRKIMVSELRSILTQVLPEYMIPTYFVQIDKIPLTPNGKVDRKALPEPEISVEESRGYIAPRNDVEEKLAGIWEEVLNTRPIGIDDDFFELGGNSISMVQIVNKISDRLQVEISLRDFTVQKNIAKLAEFIKENKGPATQVFYPSKTADRSQLYQPFPLSDVQTAYLMGRSQHFEMGNVSTHMYIEIETKVDMSKFNWSLNQVIQRHPMLQAVILPNGEQQILTQIPEYKIQISDVSGLSKETQTMRILAERDRMSHYVFKTDEWPLFEVKAFRIDPETHYLFIGLDPLVADAASLQIISREIMALYQNPERKIPEIDFSFRDYIMARREFRDSPIYKRDRDFWLAKLEEFPQSPAIPLQQEPGKVLQPHFKRIEKTLPKDQWGKLKKLAKEKGVTPSALLCTAYADVLAYWSNQPHLAVNLTLFNRYPFHPDVNQIVGDFTSVLLLDLNFATGTFWEKAKHTQDRLFEALEHRHFDGIEFIREIAKFHNLGTKAVMPVVFTSVLFGGDDEPGGIIEFGEVKMSVSQTSQVFLDHQVIENKEGLLITWDYVDELFGKDVIERMFSHYLDEIAAVIRGSGKFTFELSEYDRQIITNYNATEMNIESTTLHHLFGKQVERTPENIAVIFETERISYRELDDLSNQTAHYLREHGIGRGDLVGVLAQRVPYTIVNILGILKAGAAYVPIDPAYPAERKKFILENSQCKLLLNSDLYFEKNLERYSCQAMESISFPEDVAYVIHTSGSTGRPKGVVITHQAAANTVIDINQKFKINEQDRIIGLSSLCFDLSVYDIFGALSTGAALVQIPDQRDAKKIIEVLKTQKITVWNSVPAIMGMLVDNIESYGSPAEEKIQINLENSESKQATVTKEYHWSPIMHWQTVDSGVQIGNITYSGVAPKVFPEFYFLTQKGISLDNLVAAFSEINPVELQQFIEELIQNRVLVNTILTPQEVFSTQDQLFKNEYGQDLIFISEEYHKFKTKQLNRSINEFTGKEILLEAASYPKVISKRRTYREFDEDTPITFRRFSQLLGVCKQTRVHGEIRYFYASGGGLYPLDIFVYVKANRVENLAGGLYFYDPVANSLRLVNDKDSIHEDAHYYTNKSIFNSSAFSIFMLYNAEVTMPRYGSMGYFYAIIDAGLLAGLLAQAAETLDIGLCSIGDMDFKKIAKYFNLKENQVLIHTIEGGLKPDREIQLESQNSFDLPGELEVAWGGEKLLAGEDLLNRDLNQGAFALRLVMLSGDWIPLTLPGKIKQYFSGSEVISLGGATEASIWSIYYPVRQVKESWRSIPYGIPLANQQFYVLNYQRELCPLNVEGELYIGGVGLAREYLNDPEKTTGAFIHHPQFGRLYRTGDYGVMRNEGYIEFLGRKDQQVKIKGYRIELGEIESCLLKSGNIKEAVVTDWTASNGSKYLCAYLVSDHNLKAPELRELLRKQLPDYMVPSYFLQLAAIPLTANGKVDRKALPQPSGNIGPGTEYVAPRNQTEENLAQIWKQMLNVEKVSMYDDFFELGGDSLKAALLMSRIHKEYNVEIPLGDLFRNPTIDAISSYIKTDNKVQPIGEKSNLVLLNRGANENLNLFFIHGGSGEVHGYVEFCNNLGSDFICWGIKTRPFDNYCPKNITVEQIAGDYLDQIKKIQPQGPYYINGWCFGGTIAFEIIRQMEMLGDEIKFFALINSIAPENGIWGDIQEFSPESEKKLVADNLPFETIMEQIKDLNRIEEIWPIVVKYIIDQRIEKEVIVKAIPDVTKKVIPNFDQLTIRELLYYLNVVRTFYNTRALYIPPSIIQTKIHFFEASKTPVENKERWGMYSNQPVERYRIEGDHFSIFTDPENARSFANAFMKVFNRIL